MREAGLVGAYPQRRRRKTTVQDPRAAAAPDLVGRRFGAEGPNRLWVADLVYVPTQEGVLYLSVVLDVWSRMVVGWAMRPDARAELVVDALEMALWRRRPAPGLVHHSDRGAQYTSLRFGARLRAARILASMGRKGDAYEVPLCEAFFATLNREVLRRFSLPHARRGLLCALRLPGGVLQPEAAAFCSGVPVPRGVREEVVSESRICQCYPVY
jgi:putative transposase